jgi:hypothetical protein
MIIGIISMKVERCKQVRSKWNLVGIILLRVEGCRLAESKW